MSRTCIILSRVFELLEGRERNVRLYISDVLGSSLLLGMTSCTLANTTSRHRLHLIADKVWLIQLQGCIQKMKLGGGGGGGATYMRLSGIQGGNGLPCAYGTQQARGVRGSGGLPQGDF